MRLKRNISPDGSCRYIAVNTDKLDCSPKTPQELAAAILRCPDAVTFVEKEDEDEFFLIKLKDINSEPALRAYAESARTIGNDPELADDVDELADRSGPMHPYCKQPD